MFPNHDSNLNEMPSTNRVDRRELLNQYSTVIVLSDLYFQVHCNNLLVDDVESNVDADTDLTVSQCFERKRAQPVKAGAWSCY
jgi:hypothetical protein